MAIDMFSTRVLLSAIEQIPRPKTFILDTFFKTVEISSSKYVDIDVIKGQRLLAPFVSPKVQGVPVEKIGYTTNIYEPPYIKVKTVLEPEDFEVRDPGQTIYGINEAAGTRAQQLLGKKLIELDEMITRREEWMAASSLLDGKIPVHGEGVDLEIDFHYNPNHMITLLGDGWNDPGKDPLSDLDEWADLIAKDSGLVCDIVIMGLRAAQAFLRHTKVREVLDIKRMEYGEIKPKNLANGARYLGYLNTIGADIYSYSEKYVSDGNESSIFLENRVLLGSTRAKCILHYGAIKDLDCYAAVARFPKSWTTEDPSARHLMLQSAPLPAPHQIDAFVSALVCL